MDGLRFSRGLKPTSPAGADRLFTAEPPRKPDECKSVNYRGALGADGERVTGRKPRGVQMAGGNKLQAADFFPLLYTKLKQASFNSVLMIPGSALS